VSSVVPAMAVATLDAVPPVKSMSADHRAPAPSV
jgi:hypothetical protein